ncbi:unnamed protein product, partial [Sphenostylis stenocarpa]
GGDSPLRKEEKNASELLGLKQGTACPAPRNVANSKRIIAFMISSSLPHFHGTKASMI